LEPNFDALDKIKLSNNWKLTERTDSHTRTMGHLGQENVPWTRLSAGKHRPSPSVVYTICGTSYSSQHSSISTAS